MHAPTPSFGRFLLAVACTAMLLTGCTAPPADVDGVIGPIADGVAMLHDDLIDLDGGRADARTWGDSEEFAVVAVTSLREQIISSVDAALTVPAEGRRGLLITAAADLPEPDRDLVVAIADVHIGDAQGPSDFAAERRLTDAFVDFILAIADTDPNLRTLLIQAHNDSEYSPPMTDDLTGDAFLAADHPHVDNMALAASQEVSQEIGRAHASQ